MKRIVEGFGHFKILQDLKKYKPKKDLQGLDKHVIAELVNGAMDTLECDMSDALEWLEMNLEEVLGDNGYKYESPDWDDDRELEKVVDYIYNAAEHR